MPRAEVKVRVHAWLSIAGVGREIRQERLEIREERGEIRD
jgi:hypothetical protein